MLSQQKYELLCKYYWVQDYGYELYPCNWIFHPNGEPKPKTYVTTDKLFKWRKPTFQETLERQEWFDTSGQDHCEASIDSEGFRKFFDNRVGS